MIKNTTDNHLGLINNLIYQNTKSSKYWICTIT